MKTRNQFFGLIAIAIIATAIIGCGDGGGGNSSPQKQPDTTRTLSFGTDCKVTIKSDDLFLTAEWTALCDKVVAAIERGYNGDTSPFNEAEFKRIFASNISIVLLKTTTYKCEVKSGNYTTILLKTSTLDTVDIKLAVWALGDEEAYQPS